MIRKGLKLLLIVLWMGLIFSFSMDTAVESSSKSETIIIQVSKIVLGDKLTDEMQEEILEKMETPVRKSAHFILYLILEIFVLWFFIEFYPLTWREYLMATLIVFIYACSDEFHQLFVLDRSGEVLDAFLDTFGGSVGAFLYYLRRRRNGQEKAIS